MTVMTVNAIDALILRTKDERREPGLWATDDLPDSGKERPSWAKSCGNSYRAGGHCDHVLRAVYGRSQGRNGPIKKSVWYV